MIWLIAFAFVALQLAVVNQYGIFRDELYYLACGERLSWGYVDHPPFVALIAWVSRRLFGDSLLAIRLLSGLAGGATLVLTGYLARAFGGDSWASALAAISVAISPVMLFQFHVLSMNPWDILWWTAVVLVVVGLLNDGKQSRWLLAGLLIGVGLQTKLSMAFLVFGLGIGLILTRQRQWLRSPYVLGGAAVAILIIAPHVAWQVSHGWPTIEFIRNAEALKNAPLTPLQFAGSLLLELHPFNGIVLASGLWFLFTADKGRFRPLGWAFAAIVLLIFIQNGKTYYVSPSYPWMLAAGSVGVMRFLSRAGRRSRGAIIGVALMSGAIVGPAALPVLPIGSYISYTRALGLRPPDAERNETGTLPQFFADMFGWDAIVSTVAAVYGDLPDHERAVAGIVAPNYGVAGAIEFLGPRHGLPIGAISPHNSYYLWGPGAVTGEVLIVLGGRLEDHLGSHQDVQHVATIECGYCMPFENHRAVYVLRGLKRPMQELWRAWKIFV